MKSAEFDALLADIAPLRDYRAGDFEITELPGFTNRNYRLRRDREDWVLRIPRAATNRYIDRDAEAHNLDLAQRLGFAPKASWFDPAGISLTPTLRASRVLRAEELTLRDRLAEILEPLRRLHQSGADFRGRVDLRALLWRYFGLLKKTDQAAYRPRLRQAERVLQKLAAVDLSYVPSHNDLVLENLLWQESRLWIIDWEYSAMASPYWDLATLCNAAGLNDEQSRCVLDVYCAGAGQMEESMLFDYRGLLELLSDCWMKSLAAD